MKEAIKRYSILIGVVLGIVQGIPQGMNPDTMFFIAPFAEKNLQQLLLFGVFGPPLLAAVSHFMFGEQKKTFIDRIGEYVNLPIMVSTGCLALGLTAAYHLQQAGAPDSRLAVAYFFVAGGIGFFFVFLIEGWRQRKARRNA